MKALGKLTVERHFVASLVDPKETQVIYYLVLSQLRSIDGIWFQVLGSKVFMSRILHGVCNSIIADPVADIIGVTCPGENPDTALDDF